jgi:cytochrome c oxidase assembly factor CtaG
MDPGSLAIARPLEVALILGALFYSVAWYHLRKDLSYGVWRLAAFMIGLTSIAAVWTTRLANLDHHSLTAHMVQHLVLMTVAAPLILLAEPGNVLRDGLVRPFPHLSARLFQFAPIHGLGRPSAHPILCWFAGTASVIFWHVPALFELGMRSEWWHAFEQAIFLAGGLLFWCPVVRRWSSATRRPHWSIALYLFLATLPCDALASFLTFCGRVVYPTYTSGFGLFDRSALRDQEFAGSMMWAWVTFAYLIPAIIVTLQVLSPRKALGGACQQ